MHVLSYGLYLLSIAQVVTCTVGLYIFKRKIIFNGAILSSFAIFYYNDFSPVHPLGYCIVATILNLISMSQIFGALKLRKAESFAAGIGGFMFLASILTIAVIFFIGIALSSEPGSGYYYDYSSPESDSNIHHVDPHYVDDYYRSDGTHVDGYWRGGSDGYYRSNPDGNPYNNLKP